MSKLYYTESQQQELRGNKYVLKCSAKYIQFTDTCKKEAITLHQQGKYYKEIFKTLGFPEYIIISNIPKECMKRWKWRFSTWWETWLRSQTRGRKKQEIIDTSKMSKDEYISYLEAQVASMKEVEKFLKKWRDP